MKRIKNLCFLILTLVNYGCSKEIEIKEFIDVSDPFLLTTNTINPHTGLTESKSTTLEVNSEKWKEIIKWIENSNEDWQSSPASYIGDIYIGQDNFRLICNKNSKGVVIAFNDREGKPKQLIKTIREGELNFLYE